jgi:hypothetical protein
MNNSRQQIFDEMISYFDITMLVTQTPACYSPPVSTAVK